MKHRLRIDERNFNNKLLEAYYTEHPRPAGMAIQHSLPVSAKRAREIEAHGYFKRPPTSGRKFCFTPRELEDVDPVSVRAIRSVIEDLEPGWIDSIKAACLISNEPRVIAAWSDIPLQVVVAILSLLEAKGELPQDP